MLAGTDNDYSITQDGGGIQLEVLFNNTTGQRIVCDIGTLTNCLTVPSTGGAGVAPYNGSLEGFAQLPGVLHAYKSDIVGFAAPVPEPGTWAMFMVGLGLLGAIAKRRKAA